MNAPSKPPFSLVGIDHIVLLVTNLERAVRWYTEVLGCQPGYSYPKHAMEQLWCGSALIVLEDYKAKGGEWAAPPVEGGRNLDHACIALSPFDVDAFRAHLKAHNVEIVEEAFHGGARGQGNSFYVLDPDGNKLELKGPAVYPDGRAPA